MFNVHRYPGFHSYNNSAKGPQRYGFSKEYWQILAIRLAFVFVFQWFITAVTRAIAWAVPDIPETLDLKIRRENFIAAEAVKDHKEQCGKRKARPKHFGKQNGGPADGEPAKLYPSTSPTDML